MTRHCLSSGKQRKMLAAFSGLESLCGRFTAFRTDIYTSIYLYPELSYE